MLFWQITESEMKRWVGGLSLLIGIGGWMSFHDWEYVVEFA
jgi:hypothetical protein